MRRSGRGASPVEGRLPVPLASLVRTCLPRASAEPALGDLSEEYGRIRERQAWPAAVAWLWVQTVSLLAGWWWDRWWSRPRARRQRRPGAPGPSPGGASRTGTLLADLRTAARGLRRSPGFTALAVGTLALGIGIDTTAFSAVNAVLLDPFPHPGADRFVIVRTRAERGGWLASKDVVRMVTTWPEQVDAIERVEAYDPHEVLWLGAGEPRMLSAARVTPGLFTTLDVAPRLGRRFRREDGAASAPGAVILGEGFWRRAFAGDEDVVGRAIRLDSTTYTVVGVVPALVGMPPLDVFIPHAMDRDADLVSSATVWAWLAPGTSLERAQAMVRGLTEEDREFWGLTYARLVPLDEMIPDSSRSAMVLMLGAVSLVLLIACANVAHLMLARGSRRRREIALRAALGAGRGRIVRELLAESLVVAALAGSLGIVVAVVARSLLASLVPGSRMLSAGAVLRIDATVLAWTVGVSLATALVAGLWPALRASGTELTAALKEGGPGAGSGPGRGRARGLLIAGEVAMALVLLFSAVLVTRSLVRLVGIDRGFDAEGVLALELTLPEESYPRERQPAFWEQLLERIEGLGGVESAAMTRIAPPFPSFTASVEVEGRPGEEIRGIGLQAMVGPGFFRTLGIPVLEGRDFAEFGTAGLGGDDVIVNRSFARRVWPDESAVGRRFRYVGVNDWLRVVGVVADLEQVTSMGAVVDDSPDASRLEVADLQVYHPHSGAGRSPSLVVSVASISPGLVEAIKSQVWALDPDVPITAITPLAERLAADDDIQEPRTAATLLAALAALALTLAAVGIFGVVSYAAAERTREIGIRMALGASAPEVRALVVWQGLVPVAAGAVLGLAGGLAVGRLLRRLLFEVEPSDLPTMAATAVILAALALGATWLPARRASAVDPVLALRSE